MEGRNNNNNNNDQVIRLDDILYVVVKHYKTMILTAIIGALVGVLFSFAMYVKGVAKVEYYITASMAVTTTNENGLYISSNNNPGSEDIHLAEDLTDAVIYVCRSDTALNAAAERLQLIGVTASDIKPNLSLRQHKETQIIEMTLVWDNADEGILILNAITEVVPGILIETLKLGDVTIINQPKVSSIPLSFLNIKIIILCLFAGAMAGVGFFLVKFFIHPTFLHSEDIKERFGIDILGEIPGDRNYFSTKINSFKAKDFSSIQEYFSACAHVLVYRLQDIDNVCIYLTSSASQEGKTSIVANLGYALADLGFNVLLVDMDLRNPTLSSKFICEHDDEHTLNSVYRGEVDVKDAIVKLNSNLDLLPTKLDDELLKLDTNMLEIISSAKTDYDFVLIDTAPVGQVSDAMALNQVADCAVYVIRQDQVWINTVSESISRLRKSGIALLGAIMNDTKGGVNNYYYSNYKQFENSPYGDYNRKRKSKSAFERTKEELEMGRVINSINKKRKKQEELDNKAAQLVADDEDIVKDSDVDVDAGDKKVITDDEQWDSSEDSIRIK